MEETQETRQRLIEAACAVFAAKGYRDATVQDICAQADANIAAVNYYFGSKLHLYEEVWAYLWNLSLCGFQTDLEAIPDPVERLRAIIHTRVRHLLGDKEAGQLPAILYREMGDPTELNAQIVDRFLKPAMRKLSATVADILEVAQDDPAVGRCAMSIQSQFISINIVRQRHKDHPMLRMFGVTVPTEDNLNALAAHLFTFVLGGLKAVKKGLKTSERTS